LITMEFEILWEIDRHLALRFPHTRVKDGPDCAFVL
jgi:hypothetical protein